MTFDPTCDVISDVKIRLCNIFRNFKPRALKCCFWIENRSSSQIARTGGRNAPSPLPQRARSGNTPYHRGYHIIFAPRWANWENPSRPNFFNQCFCAVICKPSLGLLWPQNSTVWSAYVHIFPKPLRHPDRTSSWLQTPNGMTYNSLKQLPVTDLLAAEKVKPINIHPDPGNRKGWTVN